MPSGVPVPRLCPQISSRGRAGVVLRGRNLTRAPSCRGDAAAEDTPTPLPAHGPRPLGWDGLLLLPSARSRANQPYPRPHPSFGSRFCAPWLIAGSPPLAVAPRRVPTLRSAPRVILRSHPAGLCPGLGAHRWGPTALISRPGEPGLAGAGGDQQEDAGAVLAHVRRRSAPDLHADAQRLLPSLPELCHIQIAAPERLPFLLGVLKAVGAAAGTRHQEGERWGGWRARPGSSPARRF